MLSKACALVSNRNQKQKKHSLAEAPARVMTFFNIFLLRRDTYCNTTS